MSDKCDLCYLPKTIEQQAEQIKLLEDRLACYDATDIPETIAENQRLKELVDKSMCFTEDQIQAYLRGKQNNEQ